MEVPDHHQTRYEGAQKVGIDGLLFYPRLSSIYYSKEFAETSLRRVCGHGLAHVPRKLGELLHFRRWMRKSADLTSGF